MDNGEHQTVGQKLGETSKSPFKSYGDIYVGSTSFFALMKYELLTFFLSPLPGAIGFLLRKIFYKKLLARVGGGLTIAPNLTVRCPNNIYLGDNVVIDGNVVLDAKGEESGISIGDTAFIGKNTIFSCSSARISFGHDVSLGPNCYVRASRGHVTLGSFITIGANTVIISGNPDYRRLDIPMMTQEGQAEGITIGDDVWLGVGVRVIDGASIGNGCVIGAGAVVTKDIPAYSIAAGIPAKVLKSRKP